MNIEPEIYHYKTLEQKGYGSRVTIWRKVKDGLFPAPIDDGSGRPIWLREDLESWKQSLKERAAA